MSTILAGDVGGTKTILGIFSEKKLVLKKRYESQKYASFEDILADFCRCLKKKVSSAVFGVPGPVINGACAVVKLPWIVSETKISKRIGVKQVKIVNDFCAFGYSIDTLSKDSVIRLNNAVPEKYGVRAFIGAGTGLGEAFAIWNNEYTVYPSEGGHAGFAPQTAEERQLSDFLSVYFKPVSVDRVLSGKGLTNVYQFVRKENVMNTDLSKTIVECAVKKNEDTALNALAIFVSAYGAEAGNLALKTVSLGGIFIGGGIARSIFPRFKNAFLKGFYEKGRLSYLMKKIPVFVVMNEDAGLIGAAERARRFVVGRVTPKT